MKTAPGSESQEGNSTKGQQSRRAMVVGPEAAMTAVSERMWNRNGSAEVALVRNGSIYIMYPQKARK